MQAFGIDATLGKITKNKKVYSIGKEEDFTISSTKENCNFSFIFIHIISYHITYALFSSFL